MPNLTFDEVNHLYFLDGVKIPGYSEIAKYMGIVNFDGVSEYALEPARKFGTAGHYALKLFDEGTLDYSTLSKPLIPCVEEYQRFLHDFDIVIMQDYIEKPVCSVKYRFACTPDRICLVKGELALIDFKFVEHKLDAAVELQLAAQKIAAEEFYHIKIKARYGLQIPMVGKCRPYPCKNKIDESTWLCFLGSYNWRINHGK